MKLKRFAALALTLAMALTLIAAPASAAGFSDLTGHWSKSDVEDVADRGLVKGYTDGTFKPDNKMTYCEALLFCSRATGLSTADKANIAAAWAEELKKLLPADMISWASEEMAVCLETGILSATELKALSDAGTLSRSITRETLSMYLTRAMQLEPLAKSLSSYTMTFGDTSSIAASLQPYVYLLNSYGIIKGNEKNQFMPKGSLTRAEMATMLRRAVDFMAERGIVTELPEYTTDTWNAGTIAAVTGGSGGATLLTLTSEVSGTRSVSLPAAATIYVNNMAATTSALQVGQYARVNFNRQGTATSVRLGGTLQTYEGSVTSLSERQITLTVGGTSRMLDIDRFTEVMVGTEAGDRSLIDLEAGYSNAICQVDEMGHLATLRLSGGTREEKGIITGVEAAAGGQTLLVSGFNGVTTRYTVPTGASVTVNGLVGVLSNSDKDHYVSLRISNDTGYITSAAVDTVTVYLQGAVKSTSTVKNARTITLTDVVTNKALTYNVASNAVVTYSGETVDFRDVRDGWFATVMIAGSEVVTLDCYPGSSTTDGTITAINYGVTTTIAVTRADGTVVTFALDMSNLPSIYRNGKVSSVDKLRTGDEVVVTVRYNRVEEIEATPQSANVAGTVSRITMESAGITMDVNLSSGGSETYDLTDSVSVTQDGTAKSIYDLKPGNQISMVVVGGQVVSISIDKAASSGASVSGTVIYPNTKDKSIILSVPDGSGNNTAVTVDASNAEFRDLSNNETFYFNKLEVGDEIQVFGSYSGSVFVATIIIRF